ncbi:MAG TPA: Na/Pi cotransporter family protein [Gammaproteobacteria bacterium]
MQSYFVTFGMLIGGLGLFLLAVNMITDGLRLAAGNALRELLGKWTHTPLKGIASGVAITAIVQSSSAVTVATIGFVNAGLLSLYQALGVVYGANIGTTMTGWLVAIIGFKIKVETFALPLIGIGMILRLTRNGYRLGSLGLALAGFGLFFIGIDVLKNAFESMAAGIDFENLSLNGFAGVLAYVAIGFMMTLLTQSSSAAIAITLTAATGGVLSLEAAAAVVIGTNVGTTSTAGFAVIGATSNAKRVAAAHVIFNLATGAVALLTLPILFWIIRVSSQLLGLEDIPAITLALFHTVFNVLGVLLMLPVSKKLSRFLERRFRTADEIEGRAKYLDSTVIGTPLLALNALSLELGHLGEIARRMASSAVSTEKALDRMMETDSVAVIRLANSISEFMVKLGKGSLPNEVAQEFEKVLYATQCYRTVAELALNYAKQQVTAQLPDDAELSKAIHQYEADASTLLNRANAQNDDYDHGACEEQQEEYHQSYRQLRDKLLSEAALQRISVENMSILLEQIYRLDRMVKQAVKAAAALSGLLTIADYPLSNEQRQHKTDKLDESEAETDSA